jgi:hypothetical protein
MNVYFIEFTALVIHALVLPVSMALTSEAALRIRCQETFWFPAYSNNCPWQEERAMTPLQSFAVLLPIMPMLVAQTSDFRNTSWGMDRSQVVATEATPPSQVREGGGEIVLRYESARIAGLDCRVVYIFAKDKLVRAKYVFQQEHDGKNDFLADFAIVDAFLTGTLDRATEQRVSWRNDTYNMEPQHYGLAVSLGQLLYSTQWNGKRTVVTHALTGQNGVITHEVEYVSVDLEPWEDQITKEPETPSSKAPIQTAATP